MSSSRTISSGNSLLIAAFLIATFISSVFTVCLNTHILVVLNSSSKKEKEV